jgi:hypothetical protein
VSTVVIGPPGAGRAGVTCAASPGATGRPGNQMETWVATVRRDRKSLAAISGLGKPSSTSAAIFVSAGVRLSQPLRACRCLAPPYPQDWDRAQRGDPGRRGALSGRGRLVRANAADARRGHRRSADAERRGPGPAERRRPAQPVRRGRPPPPAHHAAPDPQSAAGHRLRLAVTMADPAPGVAGGARRRGARRVN